MPTAGPLILIVDDNLDAREMYGMYLQHQGFRWAEAVNGIDAITQTHVEKPALILMDATMPRMDGWEAIRRLREDPSMAEVPIVALSAYAFGDEPDRARNAGADLCLTKPCLPSQVGRVVRAMLLRRDVLARPSA